MDAAYLKTKHDAGLPYGEYVKSGTPVQHDNWKRVYDSIQLTPAQTQLVGSFTRKINVIGLSGIWCGDCVQQGPLFARIAEANPLINLRWVDRDAHIDLQKHVAINAGHRVPVLVFLAEDYELVSWYGDRSLARYRILASKHLGPSCPLPGAPLAADEAAATLQGWLDEFERVHILLRLSARLRKIHND